MVTKENIQSCTLPISNLLLCWFQNSFCFGCTFKTELGQRFKKFYLRGRMRRVKHANWMARVTGPSLVRMGQFLLE